MFSKLDGALTNENSLKDERTIYIYIRIYLYVTRRFLTIE